ncbi:ABC transporter substrate-binding protein [Desulforegula conservatrix]|uniref:ABC transporter substrate-binding protein n=1 Tax=Desulforegula conservatrix TaxID=153026 RepID=UPI000418FB8A|nr:ABC transporter substrate binding protein [Desulforegula conservatrix]
MSFFKLNTFITVFFIFLSFDVHAFDVSPVEKNGQTRYRLAFYEGGQYPDYMIILKQTLYGLMETGWIEQSELPDFGKDHKKFWEWASENIRSRYVEFAKNGFFAPGDFDKTLRLSTQQEFLKKADEFDLVIAMGTWAGQDLSNNLHHTPVMLASTSDPIGAGIIKSADDSGLDHFHAKVDPDRYLRQIKIFHEIMGFKKLGVIYENSTEGRTYAAMDALEQQAKNLNFELVLCEAAFSGVDIKDAEQNVIKCSKNIVGKVDAVYLTVHRGNTGNGFKESIKIFNENKIPSFSQLGADEVKNGALMSISQAGFKYVGQFHAMVAARILKGEKPREIGQIYISPARIALNMTTAKMIGFKPTVDILLVADEIVR